MYPNKGLDRGWLCLTPPLYLCRKHFLEIARKSLASRTDGDSDILRPLDLKKALRSAVYYSGMRSIEVPFTPFPLPFQPTCGIRFLARDPFDDPENPRVRYEEIFYDDDGGDGQGKISPLVGIDPNSKEYVRGGSRNASSPHLPGGEAWSAVEMTSEHKALLDEAKSLKWVQEFESGDPPELEVPGFQEYLQSLEPSEAAVVQEDVEKFEHSDVHQGEDKVNVHTLFDGILPFDDSEDEGEELPEKVQVKSIEEESPVGAEKDMASLIDKVLEGTMDLSEALPEVDKDGKLKTEEKVWAVREKVANLDEQWQEILPILAHRYPFELDTFQKEAIIHMERGNSVFVAAHTSAGKTVAAEYALALAEKNCTRAVYTSPIKTISNQKFRDFSGQFEVGLLTGDVSIRPESTCLIMTTEILRSMLYKGADIIRDIEWVIFDEVHYVNDAERGVVWEEVIIMLPDHIKLLLLSATVPNVLEFANWVGKTKQKKVFVTGTSKRPVPLEHMLYYSGHFYPVCSHETYDPSGWKKAKEEYKKKSGIPKTKAEAKQQLPTGRGGPPKHNAKTPGSMAALGASRMKSPEMKLRSERSQWGNLIEKFKKKALLPMVAFCFSKKRCDAIADSLRTLDLTSHGEKSEIHVFCDKAFGRLCTSDRNLPQLLRLKEMLKRGVGVHHAGLLPIVKEVVEMLFCRGVIKVLFATETFAMGVNAPARAVVFQSTRKHDGREFRNLLPGEYTQMAGRAGRRGLDSVGTVVIACWEEVMAELDLKRMLIGSATRLESQFRLTYSMILNLLRVEDLKIEDMMRRSFAEFHAQRSGPQDRETLRIGQKALDNLRTRSWPTSPQALTKEEIEDYVELSLNAERLTEIIQEEVMSSKGALNALVHGRIVLIGRQQASLTDIGIVIKQSGDSKNKKKAKVPSATSQDSERGVCIVLKIVRKSPLERHAAPKAEQINSKPQASTSADDPFAGMKSVSKKSDDLDDMFAGMKVSGKNKPAPKAITLPLEGTVGGVSYIICEEDVQNIIGIAKQKMDHISADGIMSGNEGKIALAVQEIQQIETSGLKLMDPISDLKVTRIDMVSFIRERQIYLDRMMKFRGSNDPMLPELVAYVKSEILLQRRLKSLVDRTGEAGLSQMPEFLQRVKALQKMGYARSDKTVTMKGRVACEINSGSELVGTEIIFGGLLSDLSPQEAVALLSALVFQDKTECNFLEDIPEKLVMAYERANAVAWNAGHEQEKFGLNIAPDEFVKETLNFGLMSVVYHWALGMPFSDLCSLTDVMEGSIVRCIVRLDETCREFRDAARVMGDMKLYKQMQEASDSIKRDIVFAASLYIV